MHQYHLVAREIVKMASVFDDIHSEARNHASTLTQYRFEALVYALTLSHYYFNHEVSHFIGLAIFLHHTDSFNIQNIQPSHPKYFSIMQKIRNILDELLKDINSEDGVAQVFESFYETYFTPAP